MQLAGIDIVVLTLYFCLIVLSAIGQADKRKTPKTSSLVGEECPGELSVFQLWQPR